MRTSIALIAALLATTPLSAQTAPKDQGDRYSGAAGASRSAVIAQNGMAATSQPLATCLLVRMKPSFDTTKPLPRPVLVIGRLLLFSSSMVSQRSMLPSPSRTNKGRQASPTVRQR